MLATPVHQALMHLSHGDSGLDLAEGNLIAAIVVLYHPDQQATERLPALQAR
jgi:hypothetical protein